MHTQRKRSAFFRLGPGLAMLLVFLFSFTISAAASSEIPYESYTYWTGIAGETSRKAVSLKAMYEVGTVISAQSLGVDAFTQLSDCCTDEKGNIYLLDGGGSRLVVTDNQYHVIREIGQLEHDQETIRFEGAQSVYVHNGKDIYICDTENARVLLTDLNGRVQGQYLLPDSPLIPDDFQYRPLKIAVDSRGYVFVLSDGSYYGALLFSPEGEFLGFYGSNKVTMDISSAISNIWDRIFTNNEKKSMTARALPYVFSDICIDHNDFVYTATGNINKRGQKGQIKKLSPGSGANILKSDDINFADEGYNGDIIGRNMHQDILGVSVDGNGFIYCVDSTYGRVFLYDQKGRMLTAFGGGLKAGKQKGTFGMANAIALNGPDVLVGDSSKNTVTVFQETGFGKLVKQAQSLTGQGDYLQAKELWENVLSQDRNCQQAYAGLARAYLAEGDYARSMSVAREGYDRETYALAFGMVRNQWMADHFWVLFIALAAIVGVVVVLLVITMKKKLVLVKNEPVRLMLSTVFHPVQTFTTIKEKQRGSLILCGAVVVVFYIFSVLEILKGGFPFTYYDSATFNSFWVLVRSVGLIALWIVGNWAICTLLGGKGKLKEIAVVTCYSLLPVIFGKVLFLILSNILLPTEAEFLGILLTATQLASLLLLVIGMIIIHDYSMRRFIGTSALTVFAMAIIVFVVIMIALLVQQFAGFIATVCMELFV